MIAQVNGVFAILSIKNLFIRFFIFHNISLFDFGPSTSFTQQLVIEMLHLCLTNLGNARKYLSHSFCQKVTKLPREAEDTDQEIQLRKC